MIPLGGPAWAFDNALPGVESNISPAPAPELGIKKNGGLTPCLDGKPHCFSSTTTVGQNAVDTNKIGRDWIVKPWTYSGMSVLGALTDLQGAIKAYPPGQSGIDEGGFSVKKVKVPNDPDEPAYLLVQFQARAGYIDDVEFLAQDGVVQVRTSSRVGYLDYGTNAKRYNWFAKKLGATKGWKTSPINVKEHLEYAELNELSTDKELGL